MRFGAQKQAEQNVPGCLNNHEVNDQALLCCHFGATLTSKVQNITMKTASPNAIFVVHNILHKCS